VEGVELESVAADANVILSAVAGKAALKVFTRSSIAVITTEKTLLEVREYMPEMAARYGLPPELLEAQLGLLALRVAREDAYARKLKEAHRRIGKRDPDDADLLALALTLRLPVWSNDNDFAAARVKRYTTAQLLRVLGIR
jgi:predicted nucleic acid-binding protein